MKKRKEEMARFADDPNPAPMILSLRTGAFGLTLNKANHVVHFDRWWNPAVEAQATDRAHRIGQTRTVVVHHIVCRGTLEDRIAQILRDKQTLAEDIIAPTSAARLARLPADTLLSLLKR
jgi:non-specific serine/threonine protein kinase